MANSRPAVEILLINCDEIAPLLGLIFLLVATNSSTNFSYNFGFDKNIQSQLADRR